MEPDDAILLERWRRGDRAAGEMLFTRYYHPVERFFMNKVGIDSGDLVQETFIACVENRFKVSDSGKFRSYLFAVAYNVLCAHLRQAYRIGREADVTSSSIMDMVPSPSSMLGRRREQRLLLEGLRAIPLKYQVILELHYWEDMTTGEIAAMLDLPLGTVRSQLRRARELVEEALHRLEQSPQILHSTISHIEDWARACHSELVAAPAPAMRSHGSS
jgi:RNA polymerase sigma-70 factor (ECF subfamily)